MKSIDNNEYTIQINVIFLGLALHVLWKTKQSQMKRKGDENKEIKIAK